MKARTLALLVPLALALAPAAGCRSDPGAANRERELRIQEDRIYELEDQVKRYQQDLAACQGQAVGPVIVEPAVTPPGAAPPAVTRPGPVSAPPGARFEPPRPPAAAPPRRRAPGPGAAGRLGPPKVQLPAQPTPPGYVPLRLRAAPATRPPADGTQSAPSGDHGNAAPDRSTWRTGDGSRQVAAIALNGLFTGGYDADGQPGDEGIAASIEPRDAQGRLVAAAAPVSVVLLDPAEHGEAVRVARWDFSADEIGQMGQSGPGAGGIHLAMTWPDRPPAHNQLRLFVRYTTEDGRRLEASRQIDVNLPGRQARRWTATTAPAARPAEPSHATSEPSRRADPVPARSWSPAPPAAQAPATPPRVATCPARPPAEPTEPTEPAEPRRKRPTWSPYR